MIASGRDLRSLGQGQGQGLTSLCAARQHNSIWNVLAYHLTLFSLQDCSNLEKTVKHIRCFQSSLAFQQDNNFRLLFFFSFCKIFRFRFSFGFQTLFVSVSIVVSVSVFEI